MDKLIQEKVNNPSYVGPTPKVLTDVEFEQYRTLQDIIGTFVWGYQAKIILAKLGVKLYKFTNRENNHNGFVFKEGRNVDTVEFNTNTACAGGLYCAYSVNFYFWLDYRSFSMENVSDVEIPDDARVYFERDFKCKMDEMILRNMRPIRELKEWEDAKLVHEALLKSNNNVTRIHQDLVHTLFKLKAAKSGAYCGFENQILNALPSVQYAMIDENPSAILEFFPSDPKKINSSLPTPSIHLVFLALSKEPSLILPIINAKQGTEEMITFAVHADPSQLVNVSALQINEELMKLVCEALLTSQKTHKIVALLRDCLNRNVSLSENLLIWVLEKFSFKDASLFYVMVTAGVDSDIIRKKAIELTCYSIKSFAESKRPVSDDLKWIALHSDFTMLQYIKDPTQEMLDYAKTKNPCYVVYDPNATDKELIDAIHDNQSFFSKICPDRRYSDVICKAYLYATRGADFIECVPPVTDNDDVEMKESSDSSDSEDSDASSTGSVASKTAPRFYTTSTLPEDMLLSLIRLCPYVFCHTTPDKRTDSVQQAAVEAAISEAKINAENFSVEIWVSQSRMSCNYSNSHGLNVENRSRLLTVFPDLITHFKNAKPTLTLDEMKLAISQKPSLVKDFVHNFYSKLEGTMKEFIIDLDATNIQYLPNPEQNLQMMAVHTNPASVLHIKPFPCDLAVALACTKDPSLADQIVFSSTAQKDLMMSYMNALVPSTGKRPLVDSETKEDDGSNVSNKRCKVIDEPRVTRSRAASLAKA